MLTVNQLSKTFYPGTVNERVAIKDLSLVLNEGDFVTIIGSNGAGKSTLFNLLSGSELADSGQIVLDAKDLTFMPHYKRSRYIGRLFQDPLKGTAPHMTIEENLALAYRRGIKEKWHIGISQKEKNLFREKLAELELGLEDRMKTKVGMLSGGQRQALTLMMSTIVAPRLLLLDEHTAALDPATAEKVLRLTKEIVEKNHITTMMITHHIESALQLGNRMIMMHEGDIVMELQGDTKERMTTEELLKAFKTTTQKNLSTDRILFA